MLGILELGDKSSGKQMGLFFLDVEKAFDNVNWTFMKRIIKEMQLGDKIQKPIGNIYSIQIAAIRINKELTRFSVQKEMRQGYPLSPLLFILVLESLLEDIQRELSVKGIKIKNFHFKYRAFAANVVFLINDPKENLLRLLQKIKTSGIPYQ